jgi:hypothetical protein
MTICIKFISVAAPGVPPHGLTAPPSGAGRINTGSDPLAVHNPILTKYSYSKSLSTSHGIAVYDLVMYYLRKSRGSSKQFLHPRANWSAA